ncbi:MAG: IPT/TIG domain-containing protein [Candidatus Sulfotelmatobacter sp.]
MEALRLESAIGACGDGIRLRGIPAALWAAPVISSISPASGPPLTQVTVNGSGFGTSSGTVSFNGVAGTVISWSNTKIVVDAPNGSAGSGLVEVNWTSSSFTFSFTPTINSISPQNVPAGQTVSVVGQNFGSQAGSVTLAGQAVQIVSWSNTSISIKVPANAHTGADAVVVTSSIGSSPSATLNVEFAPSVSGISPNFGPPNTQVTVSGTGFGQSTPGTVSFNGVAGTIISWSNTSIVVTAPNGSAGSGPVVVSWQGLNSNSFVFNFLPTIFSLSPSTVKPGYTLAVVGQNFGSQAGSVTLNGSPLSPSSWGTNSINIPVVSGDCTGPIVVTTSIGASNSSTLTVQGASCGTPLSVTANASPRPDSAGWNDTSVTVTFICSGGVAPVTCPPAQTVSTQGANQTITGTAKDASGATASTSVILNIDLTPPVITATAAPAPDSSGWNNTAVTVSYTCTDSLSGVASCPTPQTVSTQGSQQVVTGTATDKAGNSASASVTLNIGTTLPTITATVTPPPNSAGWETTVVTVSYTCTAGFAPIATCPSSQMIGTAGANQKVTGTVTDVAGNSASVTTTLNIDLSAPTITASVSPAANGNGWNSSPVTVTSRAWQDPRQLQRVRARRPCPQMARIRISPAP